MENHKKTIKTPWQTMEHHEKPGKVRSILTQGTRVNTCASAEKVTCNECEVNGKHEVAGPKTQIPSQPTRPHPNAVPIAIESENRSGK